MSQSSAELTKKRLALAIIDFLNKSAKDGSVLPDDADNIEVATNCIAEAFKVDPTDTAATNDALGGKSLVDIYTVYEKLKGKGAGAPSSSSSAAASGSASATAPDANTKEEAEKLKSQGNAAIQKKDYDTAIDYYTQALNLVPLNPIYLSNRAAAYSGAGRHEDAVNDAEMAVAADPKFAKAWSRLGFAKFALGDAKGSMEAYKAGIDAEGSGGSDAMRKGYETAKKKAEEEGEDVDDIAERGAPGAGGMPDLSNLAGMFGNASPGGGMPSVSEMMQNPMMRQMASNLMSNPDMLSNMMNNPRLKDMFGGAGGGGGGGGGMPDIGSLMQDPSIMEM
jgi:small glutamine-rich tetratricopeptide repeat-containing protein alpha